MTFAGRLWGRIARSSQRKVFVSQGSRGGSFEGDGVSAPVARCFSNAGGRWLKLLQPAVPPEAGGGR